MRAIPVVVALLVAGLSTAEAHHVYPRDAVYITIDADAVETARATLVDDDGIRLLANDGDSAVLQVDPAALDELSEAMHAKHGRCGGFMVHDSLAEALGVDDMRPAEGPPVDYRIDRPHVVKPALSSIEESRILDSIIRLSSMKNRYYRSESGANASIWLRDRWRSYTTRTDVTIELVDHGYAQKSVVMTIPGTTRPDEVVIIGGHLDSIAPGASSSNAPGADDDASGIATLTEVARVLLASDARPARTIKFMAYAAEEVGLRGSLKIARDYQKRGVKVVGVLQLDMTNYQGSDRDIWLIADHTDAGQNAFLGRLIDTYVGASWGYDACGYACSDHASWTRAGYRASMPFEARFRDSNRSIHTRNDTLERSKNNVAHAAKFARLATAYAIELADAELPTARVATNDDEGQGAATLQLVLLAIVAFGMAYALGRRLPG
jgi:bacterial leucyl aminopeptidase